MALTNSWLERMMRNFLIAADLKPNLKDTLSIGAPWYGYDNGTKEKPTRNMSNILMLGDTDGMYRGSAIINYTTFRLEYLFRNITPTVRLYNPTNTIEVVDALIKKYGLPFRKESFVSEPIDARFLPMNVTVTVNQNEWCENTSVTVRLERASVDLNDVLKTSTTLESPQLPTTILTNRTPAEYTYSMDFTPDLPETYTALSIYPVDVFDDTNKETMMAHEGVAWLASAIQSRMVVGCDWEVTNADDFALYKSQLVYNGPVSGYVPTPLDPWSPRGDDVYDNILVIRFSADIPGRAGLGYFHYNTVAL